MLNMVRKDSLLKNRIVLIGILKDLCKDIFENSIGATKLNFSLQGNKNIDVKRPLGALLEGKN